MTKLRLSILSAVAFVGAVAFLVVRQQSNLREENRALREQAKQLAPLQAENEHLSNLLAQASNTQALPSAQISELLRLRGEVGSLRRQTNELGKLLSENQRLRSSLLASKAGTPTALARERLPKESWAFVGYADPESAFQSAIWAMSQGDGTRFRASLSTGGEEFTRWQDQSDADISARIKSESDKVTAFKIIDKEAVSDDVAILSVMATGVNEVGRFRLQRSGGEWKLDGAVKDTGAPDTK